MLKERERAVSNLLAFFDAALAWGAFLLVLAFASSSTGYWEDRMIIILLIFIGVIWYLFSKGMGLGELYRSRPYSIVAFNCFGLTFFGTIVLTSLIYLLQLPYFDITTIVLFAAVNFTFTLFFHVFLYHFMKVFRRRGLNSRTIVIVGDKSARSIIQRMLSTKEWGYQIVAIVGDDEMKQEFGKLVTVLSPEKFDVNRIIAEKSIDELIYCNEQPDMKEVESLIYSCSEVGVLFRMYSPFFNMLTNKMHLHYFNTTPMLSFSNTPQDFWALGIKQTFDVLVSGCVIVFLSPLFAILALLIRFTSKGPIFFKQVRVGLRGRKFLVYKFRTMVVNAEQLKADLHEHNEMDGPTFKMTNDPRITFIGSFLRKTSLDELPQFFNVFKGDMSIVGPRPPIPEEVRRYERWQLRRLSMKPGITCVWQISPSRNSILFDDWMRMDLEYIDTWSLKLDFVIIFKTIRTMLRADGK